MTDQQLLAEIQYAMIEPVNNGASWGSDLWTVAEVAAYMNQRQRQFLKESGAILTRATIPTVPNTPRHALPSDWIVTQRVLWRGPDGIWTELPRTDSWEIDHALLDWPTATAAKPKLYLDSETPTLQIQVTPPSWDAGWLRVTYVALPAAVSNTGITFTLPEEFLTAIKWGTIADMLSKVGHALDPTRAAYAESRFREGVELAKMMLKGWA